MSYAIIKTGGKQYRVAEGDVIEVEKLDVEAGAETTFSEVLFISNGGASRASRPKLNFQVTSNHFLEYGS